VKGNLPKNRPARILEIFGPKDENGGEKGIGLFCSLRDLEVRGVRNPAGHTALRGSRMGQRCKKTDKGGSFSFTRAYLKGHNSGGLFSGEVGKGNKRRARGKRGASGIGV